jgi:hypothetical protein
MATDFFTRFNGKGKGGFEQTSALVVFQLNKKDSKKSKKYAG